MFRRGFTQFAALASVAALAVSACGGAGATTAPSAAGASTAPVQPSASAIITAGPKSGTIVNGHIVIRWYVGLGSGTNPQQIALQQKIVTDFNALQDKTPTGKGGMPIMLSMEIVQNTTATDILKTELASGNGPDIVGPVGVKGRLGFEGLWADITPLAKTNGLDLTKYDPNLLKQLSNRAGVLDGFPYAVYPSMIFFNKDLFDEAKLAYPPQKVGDKYKMPDGTMVDWTWDTVKTVAKLLSVDKNGKDASQAGFDPANQTQFGFEFQYTEGRRLASEFASGSFVTADGKTAAFPDPWKAAWTWYYNGIWTDHFSANDTERTSTLLGGNPTASGHVGMAAILQWYTCCLSPDATKANTGLKKWDIAIQPSYNGTITAPMDLDVFSITKSSGDQQDAFTALAYIASRGDLAAIYGGVPLLGDQLTFYHKYVDKMLAPQFHGNVVNWQVAIDMEKLAPAIHHEAGFPNYIKGMSDYTKVFTTLATTPGLDLNKQFTDVTTALQTDFNTTP